MRKIIFILTVMLLLFCSCDTGSSDVDLPENTSSDMPESAVVSSRISVLLPDSKYEQGLTAAFAAYSESFPGVSYMITVKTDGYNEELNENLTEDGYTLFLIGDYSETDRYRGRLVDLTNEPWANRLADGAVDVHTRNGRLYAAPFNVNSFGIVYNKRLVDFIGQEPVITPDRGRVEDLIKMLRDTIGRGVFEDVYPSLISVFPEEYWDGETNFDDYEFILQLALENVVMIVGSDETYDIIKEINPTVAENLAYLPLPVGDTGLSRLMITPAEHFAVSSAAKREDAFAARDFLSFLFIADIGRTHLLQQMNALAPFTSMDLSFENELRNSALTYLQSGRTQHYSGDLETEDIVNSLRLKMES
jgi:ABC-type glycerol-3-phosphate transport system substrate-binding protein